MNSIDGLKTCRKGLHQYPAHKRQCPECKKISLRRWHEKNSNYNHLWYEKNRERHLKNGMRYREQNREHRQEAGRRYYEQNRERCLENSRRYYAQNRDRKLEYFRHQQKQNPDKVRAISSRRRAKKKQATPPWADHAAINAVYSEALRLEKETGIKYHVDHIYPLNSPYMCGLHVAENLQILPSSENFSKSNRSWPGQLDCQRLPIHMNGFDLAA